MLVKYYEIIEEPIITENSMALVETANKYTFKVSKKANKVEIKNAVKALFDVEVLSVHTLIVKGHARRRGNYVGRTSDYKKAIVELAAGQKIDAFEL